MTRLALPSSHSPKGEAAPLHILYITSRGHSGSTLLDLLISGHSAVTSVGEIKMLASAEVGRKLCSCHGLEPRCCPYWQEVEDHLIASAGLHFIDLSLEGDDLEIVHRHNLALFNSVSVVSGCRTIVDSSKNLSRLVGLLNAVDRYGGMVLTPIHLHRESLGLAHSYVKGCLVKSSGDLAVLCYHHCNNFYRTNELLRGRPSLFVRYERLAASPRRELMRIMLGLGLEFEEIQMDWGGGPRRNIHGNDMRFKAGGPIRLDRSWRRGLPLWQILQVILFTLPLRVTWMGPPARHLMARWRRHCKPARLRGVNAESRSLPAADSQR